LRRKVLQQCDLFVGERPEFLTIDCEGAEQRIVFAQRHEKKRARAG